jgi:hypothetical protein
MVGLRHAKELSNKRIQVQKAPWRSEHIETNDILHIVQNSKIVLSEHW